MPFIFGPHVTKTMLVPEHTVEVFDDEAYWHLDWTGAEDPEGGFLYAKVAWPKLADAQRQQEMQKAANLAGRGTLRSKRPRRKVVAQ